MTTNADTCIFFDIDGTLISGKENRVHHVSFEEAVKKVTGKTVDLDSIPHHGSTDRLILAELLKAVGHPAEKMEEGIKQCADAMIEYCGERLLAGNAIVPLPGVHAIIDALRERSIPVGLVTGNLEPIAYWKMEKAAVPKGKFFGGGFGSCHTERSEMIKLALQRAEQQSGKKYTNVWHVGDTPKDITAAQTAGVKVIAVTTGKFSAADLEPLKPDHLLADLGDTAAVLKLFGVQ